MAIIAEKFTKRFVSREGGEGREGKNYLSFASFARHPFLSCEI
jgi:hypothetical protein